MPYIEQGLRYDELIKHPELAKELGELNFVFTQFYLKLWELEPRYSTIHKIFCLVERPEKETEFYKLNQSVRQNTNSSISPTDLHTARLLAALEFYRRIGIKYEEHKRKVNGDIYQEREKFVITPENIDQVLEAQDKSLGRKSKRRTK